MKLSAKPISSPGRTDKFPPPLMRFLKSNGGSRSRRSRSSPMFVRKKNNTSTIETTQEPSSPKVTCMGQVRVKRSSKQPNNNNTNTKRDIPPTRRRRCWWARKPNSCHCQPLWPNWPFFRRKPTKLKPDSESNFHADSTFDDESESVFQDRTYVDNASTPPRNALLLTRCRSAPYRSSSLASKFWSSPNSELSNTSEEPQTEPQPELGFLKDSLRQRIDSLMEPEKVEELCNGRKDELEVEVEVEIQRDSASVPTVLTRCKSEPARTGHRLDPLVNNNFWKKRRLEFD